MSDDEAFIATVGTTVGETGAGNGVTGVLRFDAPIVFRIPKEELEGIPADGTKATDGDSDAITTGGTIELAATGTVLDATADIPGVTVVVADEISPDETVGLTGATEAVPVCVHAR